MELLFGGMPDVARFVVAFMLVLGLIGAGTLLWRRFGVGPLSPIIGPRGRQPRLAVIDAASVDARRRLVLIRRDNTEHLLMIGGPTDIVIEHNITRAGTTSASREPRPIPGGDTSRLSSSTEGPDWTLPLEQVMRPLRTAEDLDAALPESVRRTAREAMVDSMRAVRPEPTNRRSPVAELRTAPEDEITVPGVAPTPSLAEANYRPSPAPETRRTAPPSPQPPHEAAFQPAPADAQRPAPGMQPGDMAEPKRMAAQPPKPAQSDEKNLAEMAQRLEAALRRPTKPAESPTPPPAAARTAMRPEPPPVRKTAGLDPVGTSKTGIKMPEQLSSPPPDLKILSGKVKAEPQPPLESLEDEMAKMLGRSPGKS